MIQSALKDPLELAQRLGARAISVVGKRKLAAAGSALDTELSALATYMHSLDPGLGRAADVSSSKMRYQMNRMRRLAANYELRREQSLGRDAGLIALNLFPDRHPQERLLAAAWFLSRYGEGLQELLVEQAGQQCPGSQSHLAVAVTARRPVKCFRMLAAMKAKADKPFDVTCPDCGAILKVDPETRAILSHTPGPAQADLRRL